MRRVLAGGAVLLSVLLAPVARAQVSLGARVGYGFALGDVGGTLGMGDWVNAQVPLQVDALYRVNPRLSLGAFFSYGFAREGGDLGRSSCDAPGADCSSSVLRAGVQGTYALGRVRRLVPWVGAGVGYEWNRFSNPAEGFEVTFDGWEYLSLQGGADFEIFPRLLVGPFLLVTVSQYSGVEIPDRPDFLGTVEGKEIHDWLVIGVRGRFDL